MVNATVPNNAACGLRIKRRPPFHAVLVYEDLTCGEHARDFYERLTRRFDGDFDFSHLMFSFSVLGTRKALQLAASSAARANLVILSFTGNTELPANVKDWVERWVSLLADSQHSAFVTLTDHQTPARTSLASHTYLRRIVEPRKIDFLPHYSSSRRRIYSE
ncbi:MAG TPA: hypothetical protein VIS71_11110 [Terrimicrobium sp.]